MKIIVDYIFMSSIITMSKIQDYSTNSPKQVLQLNNSVTLTPVVNHKRKMTRNEFEPLLKKRKEYLVRMEKVTTVIHNNNSQNLITTCSTTGCIVAKSITEDDNVRIRTTNKKVTNSIACQTENFQLFSILNLSNNAKAIKFYTGCKDYDKFIRVFETLGPDKYDLKYYDNDKPVSLSQLDQFLIVLILLKQHKSHYEISIMFSITLKDIKNIFITWIRFMRIEWNRIKMTKVQKLQQKIAILKNNKKYKVFQSKNQDCVEIIDVENNNPDSTDYLKKTYKILLNGPANYIETLLVKDIKFICERLYYFTTSSDDTLITVRQSTKKIKLK